MLNPAIWRANHRGHDRIATPEQHEVLEGAVSPPLKPLAGTSKTCTLVAVFGSPSSIGREAARPRPTTARRPVSRGTLLLLRGEPKSPPRVIFHPDGQKDVMNAGYWYRMLAAISTRSSSATGKPAATSSRSRHGQTVPHISQVADP